MLPSSFRLRTADVERVLRRGTSLGSGGIRVKIIPRTTGEQSRFAVIVSKKVAGGTAVVRNRLRRQTFDVLASLTQSKTSYDIAVTLTKKYERSTDLEVDIKEALKGKLV